MNSQHPRHDSFALICVHLRPNAVFRLFPCRLFLFSLHRLDASVPVLELLAAILEQRCVVREEQVEVVRAARAVELALVVRVVAADLRGGFVGARGPPRGVWQGVVALSGAWGYSGDGRCAFYHSCRTAQRATLPPGRAA